jgi:dTDP-4-dehydrorhamnose 3,5-epimerase
VQAESTVIPGCVLLPLRRSTDDRGDFVKLYQRSVYDAAGIDPEVAEVFVSRSAKGTVRGLHFQVPPHGHAKTVVCLAGRVFDVVVDLRVGSPAFERCATFELDGDTPAAVHIPVGCAHGFQALSNDALVAYVVSTEHAPDHDTGIRWDSVGITWPLADPIVSPRDRSFPGLERFESPFRYSAAVR